MKLTIGDFGAGRCRLSELLTENKVYSFDHHSILNPEKITECNMKDTGIEDDSLGVAVFCLSLMHQDWPDYIKEAYRCLARYGYLIIADTTASLNTENGKLANIDTILEEQGFKVMSREPRENFTVIEAVKV